MLPTYFSNVVVLPIAVFVAIGAIAWLVLSYMFKLDDDRAEQRLTELSDPRARTATTGKKSEAFQRALSKSAPALAKSLTPTTEKEMSKLRQSLVEAGFRSETAPVTYLALRAIVALGFLAVGGGGSLFLYGFTGAAAMRTFFVGAVGFYLPILVLGHLGRRRKQQIFYGLPDALDLMVVCVEAGLGLDQAMRRVATEMKKSYRII
ncbi:MAG: type II secretion system F family protein, partial [Aureliella sp.]